MSIFSEAELAQLSTEVDQQLHEIKQTSDAVVKSSEPEDLETRLVKQMGVIARSREL